MKAICSTFCNCIKMIFPLLQPSMQSSIYGHKWSTDNQKAAEVNTAEKALEFADADFYPNIGALLQIYHVHSTSHKL